MTSSFVGSLHEELVIRTKPGLTLFMLTETILPLFITLKVWLFQVTTSKGQEYAGVKLG